MVLKKEVLPLRSITVNGTCCETFNKCFTKTVTHFKELLRYFIENELLEKETYIKKGS